MNTVSQATPAPHTGEIKPTDLRGILKYIPRFQGQIFVLALDGAIVADENLSNLLVDVAVLRSLGIKIVLVHGIGRQLQELSVLRETPISDADGSGVTDTATLSLATRASSRVANVLLEGLTQNNLKCAITNAVRALPLGVLNGVDHLHTGRVERVDKDFLLHLIAHDVVPVVQPIGYSPEGQALRINSDLVAAEVASALGASKVIYLSTQQGLVIGGEVRREISGEELRSLLSSQAARIAESTRSKALNAMRAIGHGVSRIHIIDGRSFDGLINEIFSSDGVGTLIYGNEYQQIRQATRRDVRMIYNLTRHSVKRAELLHRTQQAIEKHIDQFYVFEIDENIVACVTLYFYPDKPRMAEIGSLYVMPFSQGNGIGKKMVQYAGLKAKERGATTLVALSTQSFTFFTSQLGFQEASVDILPQARLKTYQDSGRNSKVLAKSI